jgi:hypothetical protein
MNDMLIGAISLSCLVIGLFFLRFWRTTHDRFFIFFCLSFWIEAVSRLGTSFSVGEVSAPSFSYYLRLLSYLLIVIAIVDKNRQCKKSHAEARK